MGKWAVLSIDALFGLWHKKVAGSSVHPPLNSGLLFEDVGDFIKTILHLAQQQM